MGRNKYNSNMLEEILEEVRISALLFVTKDGKINCPSAENFLEWINEYSVYCIPEKKEAWKDEVRKLIYSPLVPKPGNQDNEFVKDIIKNNNYAIIDSLYNFMDAGRIMETFSATKSWEEVESVVSEQGHSGYTFSGLLNVLIEYAPFGVEFVDRYDQDRIKRDKNFKKLYNESKKYNEKRTELNKRLVQAIYNKNN